MTWTHANLAGFMGAWFVDRAWCPALIEAPIGWVKDGNKRVKRQDYDVSHYPEETRRHIYDRAWIADVAGMCDTTPWRMRNMALRMQNVETLRHVQATWLCEIKVSRADFMHDDKWSKPPQANMQFLAMPRGIISPQEIPDGWGYLEVRGGDENTARVYKTMDKLRIHDIDDGEKAGFVGALLHTLWNRDRYKTSREEMQRYRTQGREQRDAVGVENIIAATINYLTSKLPYSVSEEASMSLMDHLAWYDIRRSISAHIVKRATQFKEKLKGATSIPTCRL